MSYKACARNYANDNCDESVTQTVKSPGGLQINKDVISPIWTLEKFVF